MVICKLKRPVLYTEKPYRIATYNNNSTLSLTQGIGICPFVLMSLREREVKWLAEHIREDLAEGERDEAR